MLGLSYGELFLILGFTAAVLGPKDLPKVTRMAGKFVGRASGLVNLARGKFDNVMQHSQARQVHKELQDTLAQLETIRYEMRSMSMLNPAPFTRSIGNIMPRDVSEVAVEAKNSCGAYKDGNIDVHNRSASMGVNMPSSGSSTLHSQAITFARLAEAPVVTTNVETPENFKEDGSLNVLPVSAETAGLLPKRTDRTVGSDIILEAILEAEVANNAKHFFSQPQNQIPKE